MKKQVVNMFGQNHYLLGIDKDGVKYWLTEPEWACDWYWSFGHVVNFTNNHAPLKSRDYSCLTHWDCLFIDGKDCSYDLVRSLLKERTISDNDLWALCDYMMSFYTLSKVAELYYTGNSHQTCTACLEELERPEECEYINKVILPKLFEKIKELLTKKD